MQPATPRGHADKGCVMGRYIVRLEDPEELTLDQIIATYCPGPDKGAPLTS